MADSSPDIKSKSIPPYVAYKTFENFIDTLRSRVIPSRIDRGVMSTMSGGVQSHLTSALKSLEFVNSTGQPTERMKALVLSEGEERKKRLTEMVRTCYPFLFRDVNIDLRSVTQKHLEEQFEANTSATGATVRKCIAFFLAASRAAGIELSPHLKRTRSRGNGQRRRVATTASGASEPKRDAQEPQHQASQSRFSILAAKFPDFDPGWSEELKISWFAAFDRLMGAKDNG